jgi:hypothetical protein
MATNDELIFTNDALMQKLIVAHRVHKHLMTITPRQYLSTLYHKVGYSLSLTEFDWCIRMLEVAGVVTVETGRKGGPFVTLKDKPTEVTDDCPINVSTQPA